MSVSIQELHVPEKPTAATEEMRVQCCISGGGPAGMMLGLLLARAGVEVVVLEKHADFLRDFRGDTIHPSTMEVMHELGILDEFLKRPHQEAKELSGHVGDYLIRMADFTHLPTRCKFIALMPQWDFLNFLVEHARQYPTFHLRMQAEVVGLLKDGDRVTGVQVKTPNGLLEIFADLTVGADGRHSTVRAQAQLTVDELGAPMDVLWMRLSRRPDDPSLSLGRFEQGRILILVNRETYWQCGFLIPKGASDEMRKGSLDAFRSEIAQIAPFLHDRVEELRDWNDVKLLTVRVDRLQQWHRPGLLCIGDAAHAMSPVGGVGINLAIQDAVATANLLAVPLREGRVRESDLQQVQRRREFPTRVTQRMQVLVQNRVISRVLASNKKLVPPLPLRILSRLPIFRRTIARVVGVGIRPEHIRTSAYSRRG